MTLTRADFKRLALPGLAALAMLAAGGALIWASREALSQSQRELAAAQEERKRNDTRLARIAEEEREVKQKLDFYQQLKKLNVMGEERRLEWADAISRIRAQRELLDLRYRVERQKVLSSVQGKPGTVDFFASTMKVELALLHEEDLMRFLADLRASGNAYYSVRRCEMKRTGQAPTGTTITPRLRGECEIDLITIIDQGAKE